MSVWTLSFCVLAACSPPSHYGNGETYVSWHGVSIGPFLLRIHSMETGNERRLPLKMTMFQADEVASRQWQILFDSERAGNWDIYVMDTDGSNLRRLTHTTGEGRESWGAVWSPDRNRIAFASNRHGGEDEIYVMNADGSDVKRLTHTPGEGRSSWAPGWSPEGKKIAFTSNRDGTPTGWSGYDIYVMDADGSNVQRLTHREGFDAASDWSPDGKRITFMSARDGKREIYLMDADGSNVRRLTFDNRAAARSRWSPDGKKIAFMSTRHASAELADSDDESDIYVMDDDGANIQRLTDTPKADMHAAWSPDGKKISFASERDGQYGIFVMDADGSYVKRLTSSGKFEGHPDW